MNRHIDRHHLLASIAFAMAVASTSGLAMVSVGPPAYDLSWHTIDGGGGTSTGGAFSVSGTIGQHDAGGPMVGGSFSLTGGFWAGGGNAPVSCPTDLAPGLGGDGIIGPADLAELLASWGVCPDCPADFDGNDNVGPADLAELLANWGPCP